MRKNTKLHNKYMRKGYKITEETRKKISLAKTGSKYPNRKTRIITEEMRVKWRENLKKRKPQKGIKRLDITGENHPNWIKDRTQLKKSDRKYLDYSYMNWRRNVKKRDNSKCRLSNCDCKGQLESHHIFNWRDYPELRYVINNGITLCHFHHPRKWEEEKRMIPIFQELLSVSKENFDSMSTDDKL
jgi:hypothetical protein